MSILIVEVLPEGMTFAADRYVTGTFQNGTTEQVGQRPKILKWPKEKAIIGFVGAAEVNRKPIHEWVWGFIEEFEDFSSFEQLSKELNRRVEEQRKIDEANNSAEPLIIHIGGFEKREGIMVPVIWYIRNCKFGPYGYKDFRKEFKCTEEFWKYFPGVSPGEIRKRLNILAKQFSPFWFHQGIDLATFNVLGEMIKSSFRILCEKHPDHKFPENLGDWEKYSRMQVLMYGSYYKAFFPPGKRFVGGDVDTKSITWPK